MEGRKQEKYPDRKRPLKQGMKGPTTSFLTSCRFLIAQISRNFFANFSAIKKGIAKSYSLNKKAIHNDIIKFTLQSFNYNRLDGALLSSLLNSFLEFWRDRIPDN